MVCFILIVGFLILVLCVAILIAPKILRKLIDFYSLGSRLYLAGSLRLALGIMLLILSTHSRLWGYVAIVGLALAASGLSIFFFALKRMKKLFSRLQDQSNLTLRFYAIVTLIIWSILIYALLPQAFLCSPR